MGRFITAKSRIEQVSEPGYWRTLDNELYLDDNNELSLVPRYFWSDGYTFPGPVMMFLGDRHKFDVRPAHGHDLRCRFHEQIKVELSLTVLKQKEILRIHYDKDGNPLVVCEDIPIEYLTIEKVTKNQTDDCFKRMMIACDMPKDKINIIRAGVFFNINWWLKTGKESISKYEFYKDDIQLVNGV